jgi:tetratricopeptide (TPR) repeat protein
MPVSKKPRRPKAATGSSPRSHPPTALPDRRAMEKFLSAVGGRSADQALAQAQDVLYEAWDQTTSRARIALAKKALTLSPLCADAYVLLAEEEAQSAKAAREYYQRGVEAGELALGPEGFEDYAGQFWGFLETRPYMRARTGLAAALARLGDVDGAIAHYRDMLRLNPNDNQGIRYVLAGYLLGRGDDAALKALLEQYQEDSSAYWLYTQTLVAYQDGGPDDAQATRLASDAWASNEHVPALLSGMKTAKPSQDGYITLGGEDEAASYVEECGAAWRNTPGAIDWLRAVTTGLPPKRTARRTVR